MFAVPTWWVEAWIFLSILQCTNQPDLVRQRDDDLGVGVGLLAM